MQPHDTPLLGGYVYHVYNRGINSAPIFREAETYRYFLKQYAHYLSDYVDTYAYCLMQNHFHLLIRVHDQPDVNDLSMPGGVHSPEHIVSKQFGRFFNSYTQAFNKQELRTGSLLERPFKRKLVVDESYLFRLLCYIHVNPQRHGVADFQTYPHSSYQSHLLPDLPTRLRRDHVLDWFGNADAYIDAHLASYADELDELLLF